MKRAGRTFVMAGAGNLGTQLSLALKRAGYDILQVYSHTALSARQMGEKLHISYTSSIAEITRLADVYIIAVKDNAVEQILREVDFAGKLVAHTAGSLSMDIFKGHADNYGIFYPLQTFSKTREISFKNIPVFIEANTPENEAILKEIAMRISGRVFRMSFEKRKILHLAAVFACNFANHMYSIANELLEKENIPFDVLGPLIKETFEKALETLPNKAQTGPAARNDQNIIKKHLELLSYQPQFQEIYKKLSNSILKFKISKEKQEQTE